MSALWQLDLLWGVVIGAATGCLSSPLAAIVATRWFVERRGLATGLLSAAYASGQLVFLPSLALLVARGGLALGRGRGGAARRPSHPGGARCCIRERPADLRPPALRRRRGRARRPPRAGNPFAATVAALATRRALASFWLLAGTFFDLRRHDRGHHRHPPDPGGARPRHRRGPGGEPAGRDRRVRPDRRHHVSAGSPTAGTRARCCSPSTRCAACRCSSCRSCWARRRSARRASSWSSASTGWRPCRRPSPSPSPRSAASGRAWCSAGSSPPTSSGPRRPRGRAGVVRASADTYVPAFLGTGLLGIAAAAMTLGMGASRRGPRIAAPPATTTVT